MNAARFALAFGLLAAPSLAAAQNKPYTITVAPVKAKAGQPATASVVIKPAAGFHMNKEFPTSLKLKPPEGVTVAKASLNKGDAKLDEQEARFEVVATAATAGRKEIPGDLRFAVCSSTSCDPQRAPITVQLEAN